MTQRRALSTALSIATTLALTAAAAAPAHADPPPREVLFVANNWDGTASALSSGADLTPVAQVDVVPDRAERMREIYRDPVRLAAFLVVRETVGEGHDQLADDLYTTPDGTSLVVSRPSFADVVSISLRTGEVEWRFRVSGFRADHMAVSPDGTQVAVSASTGNRVHVLDIETGAELGSFRTGDKPHENVYTADGLIWNMSIGEVNNDLDDPALDFLKGDRVITVADAATFEVVREIDMRDRLDAAGLDHLSDAVRPAAFSPDGSRLYFQVSFFGGFLEYDVASDRITRVATLPRVFDGRRTDMVNDSRHHGLTMQPTGEHLCVAGTMDDYAVVVDRATLAEGPLVAVDKPYWATVTGDGAACVVSESGADQVTSIDFATGEKITSVPVGDHPQRVRLGTVPAGWSGVG
ncbi:YncE family protein [Promicromonospora citrea]|uniref:Serine/threonine protein kinase n=1 Tax=Promicromonospora citrea TaxID=43677 RepID=A0A8H9L4C6_9MICO|nr:YncE family protein [Promicromonospora citrea]NNH54781.1 YncE family protein [Promicromonospora citrea]GGM19485.1 serine/threonine protein kinase [Promicromonospora citrea]